MTTSNTKDLLSKVLIFAVGAAIGSAVSYKLTKTKYEKILKEDIVSSVKERLPKGETKVPDTDAPDMYYETAKTSSQEEYETLIKDNGYAYSAGKKEERKDMAMDKPYVVSPDDFGEVGYPTITLWYYADGVVTNERNKIVTNVDELIGLESLNHFGDYEDDAVHVRNDAMEIDYEILKDRRNYSEIS